MKQAAARRTHSDEDLDAAQRRIRALEQRLAEQERAIAALSEAQVFREAVIEHAAEGVCVCHDIADSPYVAFSVWNQRMTEVTGYTMEEINRQGWYQTLYPDPEYQGRARARMERMRAGENLEFERWEITRADGEKRWIAISTSVLTSKDGSVHVLGLMHDFTERERLQTEAALARMDELTKVKNRRGFLEDGGLLFKLAERQDQHITLAYIDVDELKKLNDTRGHAEGDQLLEAVGRTLSSETRSSDVVGRLGGDEFAVVLPGTNSLGAKALFGRLHGRLLRMMRDRGWDTGVSIGVVTFAGAIPDIRDAVSRADAEMYEAKKCGKGRLVCTVMGSGASRRRSSDPEG